MTKHAPYRVDFPRLIGTLSLALCLSACTRSGTREIQVSRTVDADMTPILWNAPETERFGVGGGVRPTPFVWDLPDGWTVLPTNEFRQANFNIQAQQDVDCYVSLVQGGAFANLNRWRGQMGMAPLSPAEIQALPQKPFLGTEAAYVEMDGTFADMQGGQQPGFKLAGLILETPQGTVTFKMIGPADAVQSELERFLALAESFRIAGAPPPGGQPPAAPGGQPPAAQGSGVIQQWSAPPEWRQTGARPMRDVSFQIGDGTECWVSTLGMDAGGEPANVQRWRAEMGNMPVTRQETITMLGGEGTFVEIAGNYGGGRGGQSVPDALMLATMRMLGDATVFVKMIGPRAEVEANRAAFLQFCSSLSR